MGEGSAHADVLIGRRAFMQRAMLAAASSSLLPLVGCEGETPTVVVEEFGPGPNVFLPFFAGFEPASSAPDVPLNIFFPSRRENSREIVTEFGPYPLVLFLHGNCTGESNSYTKWTELPAELARSGYVVAVPRMPGIEGGRLPSEPDHPDHPRALAVLQWMRSNWAHRGLLASQTVFAGHSYGALLAGRLTAENPSRAAAVVLLSGVWDEWNAGSTPLGRLGVPALLTQGGVNDLFADLSRRWTTVRAPKHKVVFEEAEHFDYLPSSISQCAGNNRGPCSLTPALAADLTTMFLSKYVPPAQSNIRDRVPDDLAQPIAVPACQPENCAQRGPVLTGLNRLRDSTDCRISLEWETARGQGSSAYPRR